MVVCRFPKQRGPRRRHRPGVEDTEVLQEIGHARERPVRQSRRDSSLCLVVHAIDDGIDRRVRLLDPLDRGGQKLARLDLAGLDETRQPEAVMILIIAHVAAGCSNG